MERHEPPMIQNPFKDPIKPRGRESSRWFVAPTKEGATCGRFMPPGDDYGTGFANPVGKFEASNKNSPIPKKAQCFPSNLEM